MKQAEFARLCSVSEGYVCQLKARGMLVTGERGIDPLASLRKLKGLLGEERRRKAALRLIDAEEAA
ncbi:MAG TPA: hypothetical protein DDZ68_04495 [Parvularcula sp.]|nr:hypothetical protein [Parvularcula sp.]HBS31224.1 hypothetical protein [Parvularcula sp.]